MEGSLLNIYICLVLVFKVQNVLAANVPSRSRLISFSLPDKRNFKISLGYDEDKYFNFTELTTKYGFPTEEHKVITEDGYILTLFRILSKCSRVTKGFPIILMHGVFDTADDFILSGPETGVGYILANNCYDVWAANHRGNVYSRRHVTLNPDKDPEFWEYTFDEHGNYDLPAIVDYVLSATRQPKVCYMGHSQGCTNFFVMTSLRPEYNQKVQISFHLAPVAWMKNIRNPLLKLISPAAKSLRTILQNIGIRELFGKQQLVHFVLDFLCHFAPDDVCGGALTASTGYRRGNIPSRTLSIAFGHMLAGVSLKDLSHFAQLVTSGMFQRFNEGIEGNLQRYGTSKSPEYNVSRITSAVVLFCARNDWLSTLEDTDILSAKLPNLLEYYVVPDTSWSHNDYLLGVQAPEHVFPKILDYLDRYNT